VHVELTARIRGSERRVRWRDGELAGDDEIVRRLERVVASGLVEPGDFLSVLRGVEMVTAQHVDVVELDLVGAEVRGREGRRPLEATG
jgi:hypothetical protein